MSVLDTARDLDRREAKVRPIATGSLAARLRASVTDTVAALEQDTGTDPFTGLLFAYVGRLGTAERIADRAIASIAERGYAPALYGGFTGVAWMNTHLFGETNEEVDDALATVLASPSTLGSYDLISGDVGLGVYLVEQLRIPSAAERAADLLERIVARLSQRSVRTDHGVTWLTPPEQLPLWQRTLAPRGYYNLGIAHGVPGIIALLGSVCEAGIATHDARVLLDGAVENLLACAARVGRFRFQSWIAQGESPPAEAKSRVAWCYGDLGVAIAMLGAARCVGEASWEREAVEIASGLAHVRDESAGVVDPGLCHGSAGVAHVFHRFHSATGIELFRDAALYWFERTLALRRPEGTFGGYQAWRFEAVDGPLRWQNLPGFLEGAAGVALALHAAVSDSAPDWERLLLIPPQRSIENGNRESRRTDPTPTSTEEEAHAEKGDGDGPVLRATRIR